LVEGFTLSNDLEEMNLDMVHDFLSHSYWAKGIPFETLKRALENSLCFGIFSHSNEQVAFARAVTDYATYAYLADVFVLEEYRGKGISKWLMQSVLEHPQLQGFRRITLATQDAHALYEQFGFKPLASPQIFMERWNPDVYSKA
jgi:GNAT superfamily N-acetyltransferase